MDDALLYRWSGDAWVPLPKSLEQCRESFEVGQLAELEIAGQRSRKSHCHQFAELAEYWHHLPEYISEALPSPEHLRKHALCVAGYCDIEKIALDTHDDALKLAAFCRPRLARAEDYVVIQVTDRVVTRYFPHSQSLKAMGKKEFQASKDAVLEVCARLVGGTLEQLRQSPPLAPSHSEKERAEA